jgi:hypothetical protein
MVLSDENVFMGGILMRNPTKVDAIISLVGGGIRTTEGSDVMEYLSGQTPPSEEAIEAKLVELTAEYDANQYQRDRQYPTWQEQMDMQYHDELNGTTTWKDAVAKVKSDNPKG